MSLPGKSPPITGRIEASDNPLENLEPEPEGGNNPERALMAEPSTPNLTVNFPQAGQDDNRVDLADTVPIDITSINLEMESGEDLSPEQKAEMLVNIGNTQCALYQQHAQLQDINVAIACYVQAVSSTSDDDPRKAFRISSIGNAYLLRFTQLGQLSDIEAALAYHRQALSLSSPDHDDIIGILTNLSGSYLSRFETLWELEDVQAAIDCQTRVLSLTDDNNPIRPSVLNNIGRVLESRYRRFGDINDLNKAITYQSEAIALTSDEDPSKPGRLNNLGFVHLTRFECLGLVDDLNMSIEYQTRSVSLTPQEYVEKYRRLEDLCDCYHTRFIQARDIEDLQRAIEGYQQVTEVTPDTHPAKPFSLNSLAISLVARYGALGDIEDLESAIALQSQAVLFFSDDNQNAAGILSDLAISLHHRYRRFDRLVDLDNAIALHVRSINLTPEHSPRKATRLNNGGAAFQDRLNRLGEQKDLEQAMSLFTQALNLVPKEYDISHTLLMNLGALHYIKYQVIADLGQLESALTYLDQALHNLPSGHPYEHTLLNNLGLLHAQIYESSNSRADLEKAIQFHSRAAALLANGHAEKSAWLNNLGNAYNQRYNLSKDPADLENAISIYIQASGSIPEDHPLQTTISHRLGNSYYRRFIEFRNPKDLESSTELLRIASASSAASPSNRLSAALEWARIAYENKLSSTQDAYTYAMALVPQVVWIGDSTNNRYRHIIERLDNATLEASTVAVECEDYDSGLEWVEAGKSMVWRQVLQLRTPLEQIYHLDEILAKDLEQTSQELRALSAYNDVSLAAVVSELHSPEQVAQRQRRLAEHWEKLVLQARSLPGMSGFLLPEVASDLITAARASAVVYVIVYKDTCNALVVAQGSSQVAHVPLPNFTSQKARSAHRDLVSLLRNQTRRGRGMTNKPQKPHTMFQKILLMLWTDIVEPVLDHLGFKAVSSEAELPRITWCTTGALNFLPLHAAGDYTKPSCTLFDRAVSSYTPSLRPLIASPSDSDTFLGILAVGQTSTAGLSELPGTAIELDQICRQAQRFPCTRLDGESATTSAVLNALSNHSWVHFACHASQDLVQPTMSAFHLHDGTLELGRIAQNPLPHAQLAFLSACQTATGDEKVPDEAVHLAAGMLMAGFRTVIATMWSIEDDDAPIVAEHFYSCMIQGEQPSVKDAARALHRAVGHLRKQVGLKSFARWMPYIHIGV